MVSGNYKSFINELDAIRKTIDIKEVKMKPDLYIMIFNHHIEVSSTIPTKIFNIPVTIHQDIEEDYEIIQGGDLMEIIISCIDRGLEEVNACSEETIVEKIIVQTPEHDVSFMIKTDPYIIDASTTIIYHGELTFSKAKEIITDNLK